jgi:hypothetical protein
MASPAASAPVRPMRRARASWRDRGSRGRRRRPWPGGLAVPLDGVHPQRRIHAPGPLDALNDRLFTGLADIERFDRALRPSRAGKAKCCEAPFVSPVDGLVQRHGRHVRVDPFGQVPEPLVPLPARDGDLTAAGHEVQQLGDVSGCWSTRWTATGPSSCPAVPETAAGRTQTAGEGCRGGTNRWPAPSRAGAPASRATGPLPARRPSQPGRGQDPRQDGSSRETRPAPGPAGRGRGRPGPTGSRAGSMPPGRR